MLRPLSTYLLLVVTCTFSLMGLTAICLDNFMRPAQTEVYSVPAKQVVLTQDKTEDIPVHEVYLYENFDAENETEVETDARVDICTLTLPEYSIHNFQCFLSNAITSYSFVIVKIEFLDIFSPPPNC